LVKERDPMHPPRHPAYISIYPTNKITTILPSYKILDNISMLWYNVFEVIKVDKDKYTIPLETQNRRKKQMKDRYYKTEINRINIYNNYLREIEGLLEDRDCCDDIDYSNKLLDCIIKIKTIQAMNL